MSEEKDKNPVSTEDYLSQEAEKSVGEKKQDEDSAEGGAEEEGNSNSVSDDGGEIEGGDSRITTLQERVEELEESVLRVKAEADNIRKRAIKDVEAAHKFGKEKFVKDIFVL